MAMNRREAAGMLRIDLAALDALLESGELPYTEVDGEKQIEMWNVLSLKRRGGFGLLDNDSN